MMPSAIGWPSVHVSSGHDAIVHAKSLATRCRPTRFHDLRHTTASLLLVAGASIAAVQKIMRHRDLELT